MNLPPVRFMGFSLSTMPRANMRPALGPPMLPTLMLTLNGNVNFDRDDDADDQVTLAPHGRDAGQLRLPVPYDREPQRAARALGADLPAEPVHAVDRHAVDLGDDVARPQRAGGRACPGSVESTWTWVLYLIPTSVSAAAVAFASELVISTTS